MITRYRVTLLTDDGDRVLAKNQLFITEQAARAYANNCAQSRRPEISTVVSNLAPEFFNLRTVKLTDNNCTVGRTSIHARGWDFQSCTHARYLAPSGHWTPTTYVDGDEKRAWGAKEAEECDLFGDPISYLSRGAYFNFMLGIETVRLLTALDMTNELLRLMAGGGRHKWPPTVMDASIYT